MTRSDFPPTARVRRARVTIAGAMLAALVAGATLETDALAAESAIAAATPSRDSLIDPTHYRGLAADHRAAAIGDLVTIYVQEATRAKSQAATAANSDVGLQAGLHSPSTAFDAGIGFSGANNAGAQTTRVGELHTQMSARVVGVDPDGSLRISGEQTLMVNGERQRIRISGVVRPEDIDSGNAVWSNRIADADIELAGFGVVSESQRQSVLYRVMKWLRLL